MTCLMIMSHLFKRSLPPYTIILWILFYTLILGIVVELVQAIFNREMDFWDLYRNFLGCFLAITFFQMKRYKKNLTIISAFIVICSLVIIEQQALFSTLSLKYQQYKKLPILADFSLKNEVLLWSEGEIIKHDKASNNNSLKVTLAVGKKYSGFTFKDFYKDWRGFNEIEFRFRSYSKNVAKLCIKITDLTHDEGDHHYNNRFNYCPKLVPGENTISIPLEDIGNAPNGRKLNLDEISQIGFFMVDLTEEKIIYVDEIKLK